MKYLFLLLLTSCAGTLDAPNYLEFNPNPSAFTLAVDLWDEWQPSEVTPECVDFIHKIEFVVLTLDETHLHCANAEAVACYLGKQSDGVTRILLSETDLGLSLKVQTHELIHALGGCLNGDVMIEHQEQIWKEVEKIQ